MKENPLSEEAEALQRQGGIVIEDEIRRAEWLTKVREYLARKITEVLASMPPDDPLAQLVAGVRDATETTFTDGGNALRALRELLTHLRAPRPDVGDVELPKKAHTVELPQVMELPSELGTVAQQLKRSEDTELQTAVETLMEKIGTFFNIETYNLYNLTRTELESLTRIAEAPSIERYFANIVERALTFILRTQEARGEEEGGSEPFIYRKLRTAGLAIDKLKVEEIRVRAGQNQLRGNQEREEIAFFILCFFKSWEKNWIFRKHQEDFFPKCPKLGTITMVQLEETSYVTDADFEHTGPNSWQRILILETVLQETFKDKRAILNEAVNREIVRLIGFHIQNIAPVLQHIDTLKSASVDSPEIPFPDKTALQKLQELEKDLESFRGTKMTNAKLTFCMITIERYKKALEVFNCVEEADGIKLELPGSEILESLFTGLEECRTFKVGTFGAFCTIVRETLNPSREGTEDTVAAQGTPPSIKQFMRFLKEYCDPFTGEIHETVRTNSRFRKLHPEGMEILQRTCKKALGIGQE